MFARLGPIVLAWLVVSNGLGACEKGQGEEEPAQASENSAASSRAEARQRLQRFYALEDEIAAAYAGEQLAKARSLSEAYLKLAQQFECDWNYGNAVHDANRFLGLISLHEGDVHSASKYLVKAGKTPGSPQLDSFGPELDLANDLLQWGESEVVLIYLNDIRSFWDGQQSRIDTWIAKIEAGGQPELTRYSKQVSFSQRLLYWVSITWPVWATAIVFIVLRKRLRRKAWFAVTGMGVGYGAMYATNWFLGLWLSSMVQQMVEVGGSGTMLMIGVYSTIGAGFLVPIIVILGLSLWFVEKARAPASG